MNGGFNTTTLDNYFKRCGSLATSVTLGDNICSMTCLSGSMQMLVKIISKKKILHVILDVHVDAGIARLDGSQRSSAATVELY